MPLSMGQLHGDDLICGYHGLAFGPNGRCTRMPAQETLNPSAAVTAFPLGERRPRMGRRR
ncbi:MAG TPA: Rieske 2Fe-2S domain-containing protein [Amycolatopsis sp.]|nr:Rieske 2Fe-2S domain-containing protein [Amycolatopsis sp.]